MPGLRHARHRTHTALSRLDAYFHQHPNAWIDNHTLASVGGFSGWRTRVSELRTLLGREIKNRITAYRVKDRTFIVSEYKFVKE